MRDLAPSVALALALVLVAVHPPPALAHDATDPVCKMAVDPDTAEVRAEFAGKVYVFCTEGCRQAFLASPREFVAVLPATRILGDARLGLVVEPAAPVAGSVATFSLGSELGAASAEARLYAVDRERPLAEVAADLHRLEDGTLAFQRRLDRAGEWRLVLRATRRGERLQATFRIQVEPSTVAGPITPSASLLADADGLAMTAQHAAMRRLGAGFAALGRALGEAEGGPAADLRAAVAPLRRDAALVRGFTLHRHAESRPAFDALAADLDGRLAALEGMLARGERERARDLHRATDLAACTRCHLEFRWGLVDDVSGFPALRPARCEEAGDGARDAARPEGDAPASRPAPFAALAGPRSLARAARAGDAAHGRDLFEASCPSCHGPGGRGDGPAADLVRARACDLGDPAVMNARDDADLARTIAEGGRATGRSWAMPAFGAAASSLDVRDVVAHIRMLAPAIDDVLPGARAWTARAIVLAPERAAPPPDAPAAAVTWFEARDAAGAPLGCVMFEAAPPASPGRGSAGWLAVAEDGAGRPIARVAFPASLAREVPEPAWRRLALRLRAAVEAVAPEMARARGRLDVFRRAPGALGRGERVYLAGCAACHGATGQPLAAERLAGSAVLARNLADPAFHAARSDAEIADVVRRGGLATGVSSQMPATALSAADLAALVAHVRSLAASPTPTQLPAPARPEAR